MEQKQQGKKQPRREVVWFGMKVTPEERRKIRALASRKGKSAARAIMDLVHEAMDEKIDTPTARELMQMSPKERSRFLKAQAKDAAQHYRTDPDLDLSGNEDIVEY